MPTPSTTASGPATRPCSSWPATIICSPPPAPATKPPTPLRVGSRRALSSLAADLVGTHSEQLAMVPRHDLLGVQEHHDALRRQTGDIRLHFVARWHPAVTRGEYFSGSH